MLRYYPQNPEKPPASQNQKRRCRRSRNCINKRAASGDQSRPPMTGSRRRISRSNGSVTRRARSINGEEAVGKTQETKTRTTSANWNRVSKVEISPEKNCNTSPRFPWVYRARTMGQHRETKNIEKRGCLKQQKIYLPMGKSGITAPEPCDPGAVLRSEASRLRNATSCCCRLSPDLPPRRTPAKLRKFRDSGESAPVWT